MARTRRFLARIFQGVARRLLDLKDKSEIWFDVGSHFGERTFNQALLRPKLLVFAFEPNIRAISGRIGALSNFVVLPMAVAEKDGCADFYICKEDQASSLLPFSQEGLSRWAGRERLTQEMKISVPTIRLDTAMALLGIQAVDFLKIDAQGMDLGVVRSAGNRLKDIRRIELEVQVAPVPLYEGSSTREQVLAHLTRAGFALTRFESQSRGQEENLTFERSG